ncbi:MAG: hypothetical protein ABI175_01955, partial [Polyangiales bacterium]
PELAEAPVALLCDVDALPSLEKSIALRFEGGDFGVYRLGRDRLLIVEEWSVLDERDWRALRGAHYQDVDLLTVRSGAILVAPLNADLVGIETTASAFVRGDQEQSKHGALEGSGVLARVEPGTYAIRRARAELDSDEREASLAFLIERASA